MSAQITIKGRVGKDMDIKFTQAGKAFVPFSVVSNIRKKDANGEWIDADTSWWECKAFGGYAEALVDNIKRGDLVTITGVIKQNTWVDKDGNKRSSYEVLVDTIAKQIIVQKYHGEVRTKKPDAVAWDPTEAAIF
jgi:single-strand DNA-binding protein